MYSGYHLANTTHGVKIDSHPSFLLNITSSYNACCNARYFALKRMMPLPIARMMNSQSCTLHKSLVLPLLENCYIDWSPSSLLSWREPRVTCQEDCLHGPSIFTTVNLCRMNFLRWIISYCRNFVAFEQYRNLACTYSIYTYLAQMPLAMYAK